jgi:dTDP-4-amino-4,6-dideoxygalactose transaminase
MSDQTRAIVAVDALGVPADWSALEELAHERSVRLIADAACSAGATFEGRPAGAYGDAAVFSLHARKGITCGEGGIVVTDDPVLAEDVRSRSSFGTASALERSEARGFSPPEFLRLGYNYKLSDILAAIANVQLSRLPDLVAERRELARTYSEWLADVAGVRPPRVPADRESAWQTYAVLLDERVDRNAVVSSMRTEGIECGIGTFSLSSQQLYASADQCPRSTRLAAQHLAIPLFPGLSASDQDRVVEALARVMSDHSRTLS